MPFYRRPIGSNAKKTRTPSSTQPSFGNQTLKWLITASIIVLLSWAAFSYFNQHSAALPGAAVTEQPKQVFLGGNSVKPILFNGYQITPIATFSIRALVLSAKNYTSDRESDLSPVDLALGWGSMSDAALLNKIEITQSERWYYWRYDHPLPVNDSYIIQHSGNVHLIPGTPAAAKTIKSIQKNDIVKIKGYLVSISNADGYKWISSTSREDTGLGSCEIILVEEIEIEK